MNATLIAPSDAPVTPPAHDEAFPAEATDSTPGPGSARDEVSSAGAGILGEPPSGLVRRLLGAPSLVYRLGLGRIFGRRFLLLTHRGRRSGMVRRTVVEGAHFDPTTSESIVVAGWGDRTQWYRNIVASPALRVETGGRGFRPLQRVLEPREVHDTLLGYVGDNPWARGIAERLLGQSLDAAGPMDRTDPRIGRLRGVAFRPDPEADPMDRRMRRRRMTRRVYDLFAGGYDRFAEPFDGAARSAGLRLLDVRAGESVVEFGSGTGRALTALGWMVGRDGRVQGFDLSPKMVERARQRIEQDGPEALVTAEVGDVTDSSLPDGAADAVFMAFILESLAAEDRPAALAECRRILRPEGRLAVVALDRSDRPGPIERLYGALHRLVPEIVDCAPMRVVDALVGSGFVVEEREAATIVGLPVTVVRAVRGP